MTAAEYVDCGGGGTVVASLNGRGLVDAELRDGAKG